MAQHCCDSKGQELIQLRHRQSRVLKTVLTINALMFVIEFSAGLSSRSTSLLADSLDMLGDATVYAFSLYVLDREPRWRASAAVLKGLIMAAFGFSVLGEALHKSLSDLVPVAQTIGAIGTLALIANIACVILLLRHRQDDINMRSTWLCSRNDIIANLGVIAAALGVAWSGSKWPDIMVGVAIAALVLHSAAHVLGEALPQLKAKT